jgi:hypothetical protein
MADSVIWTPKDSLLQTIQFQFVNIYPDTDADWIIGGAQDNGTLVNTDPLNDKKHFQVGSGDGAGCAITGFKKTGNNWVQKWYFTVSQGTLYRSNFNWVYDPNTNSLDLPNQNTFDDITPSGMGGNGQWLTLIVNDPDSNEHLYYNSKNRLFRTTTASTVTSSTWTEITGVKNTVPSTSNFSAMQISKRRNGIKYLFFGTDDGKVYRLDNASTAAATATPIDITPTSMIAGSYVAGVSINPRSPDTVMVVVSNYDASSTSTVKNIFWTGNATSANPVWQTLDGALEPVSVQSCAIVVQTSGVEYYVGTSVGLYSTTSVNGENTTWLNEGSGIMKRAIIRSLINRQKDNTLVVGTHGDGAFIAKIGNAVDIVDVITAIPPVTNDKHFISNVYPTISSNTVFYQIGNMFAVKKITVQLFADNGQLVYNNIAAYQNGEVGVTIYPKGTYVLLITSDDGRYRYIQKVVKL